MPARARLPFTSMRPRIASHRRPMLRSTVVGLLAVGSTIAMVGLDAAAERTGAEEAVDARTVSVTPLDRAELVPGGATVADDLVMAMEARFELEAVAAPEPETSPTPQSDATTTAGPTPLSTWEAVARCESGYGGEPDWTINTGNGYYGGLQFNLDSWQWVGGSGLPHEASKAEQIRRAEILLERQGWRAWPACSSQLGLR